METIYTPDAPEPLGPYSQAKKVGDLVFISGQIGIDPKTGKLAGDDIETQTKQVMANLGAILKAAGKSYADVAKATCLLKNIDDFAKFNAIYGEYVVSKPARSTFAATIPAGALVEVELIVG